MNIPPRFKVIYRVAGILVIGLAAMALFIQYLRKPIQPEPVYSPSGERVILPSINYSKDDATKYLCVMFIIQDVDTGIILFETQTGASARDRWSVHWINENMIQLSSSDIGNYCWDESSDGRWQDTECFP